MKTLMTAENTYCISNTLNWIKWLVGTIQVTSTLQKKNLNNLTLLPKVA